MTKRSHIYKGRKAPAKHKGDQPPRPPSPMPTFAALEWGEIKGQDVAWVLCDKPRPRDGSDLVGRMIMVDTLLCRCKAVHIVVNVRTLARWNEERKLPLRVGEKIGLVVSGVN